MSLVVVPSLPSSPIITWHIGWPRIRFSRSRTWPKNLLRRSLLIGECLADDASNREGLLLLMLLLMFTFTPSMRHHIAGSVTMTMAVTYQRVSSHTIGLGALYSFLLYISSLLFHSSPKHSYTQHILLYFIATNRISCPTTHLSRTPVPTILPVAKPWTLLTNIHDSQPMSCISSSSSPSNKISLPSYPSSEHRE